MALTVHRAERADLLAQRLADLLADPLPDPFAQELVVVPARGVERWLSQRLSHRLGRGPGREDGVCAGVDFWLPTQLVAGILGVGDRDPWGRQALAWPVLRAVDASLDQGWAKVLAEHLGHDSAPGLDEAERELRRGRRFAVARRLAGLFASYAEQRPDLLADWESGGRGDGGGGELPPDLAWQPELWRAVVAEVGPPTPAERHADVTRRLRSGALDPPLPDRLSLFGPTRISATDIDLLSAVAVRRDVHVWLPDPSGAAWGSDVATVPPMWRRDDDSQSRMVNPLLAAMGRDVREVRSRLVLAGAVDSGDATTPDRAPTVLGDLQQDIAADRRPTDRGHHDQSVQVHACHGPARQVEVLREVLLGMLADDPTLEPRDIVVMCPDIEGYAPLISAAFGLGEAVAGVHPGHRLRVLLADRSPSATNPLLAVLAQLLDLADGRAEASRVLDLLSTGPVRRRFGFSEDNLESIVEWVTEAGVRWAWNGSGRRDFGLADFPQNTWRFGLDRVLAGVALSDDSGLWLGPTLPYDDVSSSDITLVGRLAEAVDRIQALTEQLRGAHPVQHWLAVLSDGVEQIAEADRGEEWQLAQLREELAALTDAAYAGPGAGVELRLPDVRSMLHSRLAGRPSRANFRTGSLTVATLTPMRSVPHRVICLLGLDDGVFPRAGSIDGDDVLARGPRTGERDPRSEDRQLFLDAIMAAGERLVITYSGFHEATGQVRPPAVPLREFLDAVSATTGTDVVREHRSQAFHRDYLTGGAAKSFSFDPAAVAAARAAGGRRVGVRELHELRLDPPPPGEIALGDLIDVVTNPVRAFLRRRLEIDLPRERDEVDDAMPVELRGLDRWQAGERMLREIVAGRGIEDVLQAEWRRGTMPPGRLGWRIAQELAGSALGLADVFESSTQGVDPRARDVRVELGDDRAVVGTVAGLFDRRLVRVGYSRLTGKQRLEAWVSLVALSAAVPGSWKARAIGRSAEGDVPARATYDAPDDPSAVLRDLVALHDRVLTGIVPLAPETGRLFASTRDSSKPAWMVEKDLAEAWRRDNAGAEMLVAWGHRPTWAEATELPGGPGEPHLFGELATRLWAPALAKEVE